MEGGGTSEKITAGNGRALQRMTIAETGFHKTKRKRFLDTLAATCNVRMAAGAAAVALSSCYRLRARDPAFAEAWQVALKMGYERLEEALLDYALSRVEASAIDPEAVDPAAIEGSVVIALAERTVSNADLQAEREDVVRHDLKSVASVASSSPSRSAPCSSMPACRSTRCSRPSTQWYRARKASVRISFAAF